MDIITVIIQAIVQGFTEFLPVSSSGHLSVLQHFTGVDGEASLILSVVLHLGTLAAVCVAFWNTLWEMIKEFFLTIKDLFSGKFSWKDMNGTRRMMFMIIFATALLVPVIFFKDFFTSRQGDGDIIFEGTAFIFTAILLFFADACSNGKKTAEDMTIKDAIMVGFFQCIALFPGVSRSGSTTSSSLMCGLTKQTAITFSFILGIPAILGGSILEIKDVFEQNIEVDWVTLGIGFLISAITGFLAIKMVAWLLKKDRFKIFGIYTVVIGVLCIGCGIYENVTGASIISLLSF